MGSSRVCDLPIHKLLTRLQDEAWAPSILVVLKSYLKKWPLSPITHHTAIVPVGTPCLANYLKLQDPQLGKTFDGFSSPAACTAPSGMIMVANKKNLPAGLQLDFLCPETSVWLLQQSALTSQFCQSTKSNGNSLYSVWGLPDQRSIRRYIPRLALRFSVNFMASC